MNLMVWEYDPSSTFPTIRQQITVGSTPLFVNAIRPHLYRFGSPAGTVFIRILDSNLKKIADTSSVTITNIGNNTYNHYYVRMDTTLGLEALGVYYLELKTSGYTYNASHWVGWCNEFGLYRNRATYTNVSTRGATAPLDFELWASRNVRRGE